MWEPDLIRLRHMLEAAREALSFVEGMTRRDLDSDRKLVLSLVREIEVIGEAASKVSPETKSELPDLPWQDIIGMRNRLVHVYFDVDLDVVWDSVTKDLPELIRLLEQAVTRSSD